MAMKIPSAPAPRGTAVPQAASESQRAEPMAKAGRRQQQREDRLELSEEALAVLQGNSPRRRLPSPGSSLPPTRSLKTSSAP